MFLMIKCKTELVLMAIIGILLAPVFIQPAQGLQCHQCVKCGNSELGTIQQCSSEETYCVWAEFEKVRTAFRRCAETKEIEVGFKDFSCDEFKPFLGDPNEKLRLCKCQEDLCNSDDFSPSGASFLASQLLLLAILGSVSTSQIHW